MLAPPETDQPLVGLTAGPLRLGVPADAVEAIFPIRSLGAAPGTPRWVVGLTRYSGRLLWVIDPALLVGGTTGTGELAVRVAAGGVDLALRIDAVGTTRGRGLVDAAPGNVPWLRPGVDQEGAPIELVDVTGLVEGVTRPLRRLSVSIAPAGVR